MRVNLKSFSRDELERWVDSLGEPPYRARQLYKWIFAKGETDFDKMTDLSSSFRESLKKCAFIPSLEFKTLKDPDGTIKLVFDAGDGLEFESVLIPGDGRLTLCVSSQIGCALGCAFCMTGRMGFKRNLKSWEIIEQVLSASKIAEVEITNIVFMGMGEPLLNYSEVACAVRHLLDPIGLAFSTRRITVSTAGVGGGMLRQINEELGIMLAVSLNAPTQEIREKIMPVSKKYPLSELMEEVRSISLPPRRRITFEYVLLSDVNDLPEHAELLARLLRDIKCKVNLIPWNKVEGMDFETPSLYRVEEFRHILERRGLTATIRVSRGGAIGAACGQLGRGGNIFKGGLT